VAILLLAIFASPKLSAQETSNPSPAELISKENLVDGARPNAAWRPAFVCLKLDWHDRLRTGEDSRAAARLSDLSILRLDELTEAEVLPPSTITDKSTLDLKQGTAYFFSQRQGARHGWIGWQRKCDGDRGAF